MITLMTITLLVTILVLCSISVFGDTLTDNLNINSGMNLPDKGVKWNTSFRNSPRYARVYLSSTVFNTGECGHYFLPKDINFQISDYNSEEGLRNFNLSITYLIVNEAPEAKEFQYSINNDEFKIGEVNIRTHGNIRNGYTYIWPEGEYTEPTRVINSNIETFLTIRINSPSAEIYGISTNINEWDNSWEGTNHMNINMNGTFHTPEPATIILLSLGRLFTALRHRHN